MNRQSESQFSADRRAMRRITRKILTAAVALVILAFGVWGAPLANYKQARRNAATDVRETLAASAKLQALALYANGPVQSAAERPYFFDSMSGKRRPPLLPYSPAPEGRARLLMSTR